MFIVQPHKSTLRNKHGVYLYSSENVKVLLKIQWIFIILLSLFVTRGFRGTCGSVNLPKGYMVRKRLGNSWFWYGSGTANVEWIAKSIPRK